MSTQNSLLHSLLPATFGGKIVLFVLILIAFSLGSFFSGSDNQSTENRDTNADNTKAKATSWTCSMHPQIQLPKAGKCPICFMDLIPLESNDDEGMNANQIKLSNYAKELAKIQSSQVARGFASRNLRMNGKIAYDESRVAYVTARFPGRLDNLFVDYTGMHVNKGDHLVSIYSPELLSTQEELKQAIATVEKLKDSQSKVLIRTAKETLDAAREKLRLFDLTDEQINKIELSEKNSDHVTIYSPIEGVVVHKDAKEGMYVKTGSKIYTLADLSKLWVYFDAYESDLIWLRVGQSIQFTTTSYASKEFRATISFIDPVINPLSRTVRVRAVIDNSSNLLKPDMLVHGEVKSKINSSGKVINDELAGMWISPMHPEIVKSSPGQCDICGMDMVSAKELGYSSSDENSNDQPLLIPSTALLITGKQAVVFIETKVDSASLYEAREIKIGPKAGEFYIVYEGLNEGETVVTNGAFKIDAELQIQAKPSMMSPKSGAAPMVHDQGQMDNDVQSKSGNDMSADMSEMNEKIEIDLTSLYDAYFDIQMALADDDFESTKKFYGKFSKTHTELDVSKINGTTLKTWLPYSKKIKKFSSMGMSSSDIVQARDVFFHLSNSMIELEKTFGHKDDKDYYLTFCPMARNNEGAFWLQAVDTVYNSFYGDMMLRCGSIKDTLPSSLGGN